MPSNTTDLALLIGLIASVLVIVVVSSVFAGERRRRRTAKRDLHEVRRLLSQRIQEQAAAYQHVETISSDNARLIELTEQAQAIAEQGMAQLVQNQLITTALAEATTTAEVIDIVVRQGVSIVGAVGGAIADLINDGADLKMAGAAGYPQAVLDYWDKMPITAPTLMAQAIRHGEPIWVKAQDGSQPIDRDLVGRDSTQNAWATLPLSANGKVIGVLGLTFAREQAFTEMDKVFIISLAQRCEQALERIRLAETIRDQGEQFRITLSSIGEAVISTDTAGQIRFVNQAAQALTGWSADEAKGCVLREILKIALENDLVPLANYAEDVLAGKPIAGSGDRLVLIHDDRPATPIAATSAQIHDGQGAVTGVVLVLRDMTDNRRQQAAVTESLQRTQDLYVTCHRISLVNDPLEVLQAQFTSRYLSSVAQAGFITFDSYWDTSTPTHFSVTASLKADQPLLGLADDGQIAASPLLGLFSIHEPIFLNDVETDTRIAESFKAICRDQHIRSFFMYPLGSGSTRRERIYGLLIACFELPSAWQAADQQHISAIMDQVGVALENGHLLQEERRARADAEDANAIRLKFLAMISHELRTPLTSIKGFASTLLASDVSWEPKQQAEFITIIDQEANRLGELIEQLLDMSRLQAGMLTLHIEPRRLHDVMMTMTPQLESITPQHTLVIETHDESPFVQVDLKRIGQVFVNLVGNAAKFSPAGTTIRIIFIEQPNQVQINVSDEGPGIPPEDREWIFAAFAQARKANRRQNSGVGLGLAITKGLVEAHGGTIWLLDDDRQGATFAFTLKFARPELRSYS